VREAQTLELDGRVFHVQQLPGKKATVLFHQLVAILVPVLAKAGAGAAGVKTLADLDLSSVADAAEMLFHKLPEPEFMKLVERLAASATVEMDGKRFDLWPKYDDVFRGDVLGVLRFLKFALEVNFGPLLEGLGPLLQLARAFLPKETPSASPAPTTSPGSAGA
jgi:hypothetical protein